MDRFLPLQARAKHSSTERERELQREKERLVVRFEMDDEVVQRVFQEGGRDYFQQQPSTSSSSSSSILQSLPLHVVFRRFLSRVFISFVYSLEIDACACVSVLGEAPPAIVAVAFWGRNGRRRCFFARRLWLGISVRISALRPVFIVCSVKLVLMLLDWWD